MMWIMGNKANLLYIDHFGLGGFLARASVQPGFCASKTGMHSKRFHFIKNVIQWKLFRVQKNHPSILLFSHYGRCSVIVWIHAGRLEESLGPKHCPLALRWQRRTCTGKEITGDDTENVSFETEPMGKTPADLEGMRFSRSELLCPPWIILK